jgi:hypothetical protein
MSKEAALRAMREARYRERTEGSSASPRVATPARRPPATEAAARSAPEVQEAATGSPALCGHRSMNGRSCTREQGHAAKSHRYS